MQSFFMSVSLCFFQIKFVSVFHVNILYISGIAFLVEGFVLCAHELYMCIAVHVRITVIDTSK